MPTAPDKGVAEEKTWKRVTRLAVWIWALLPIGLWKLYKDPVLSPSAKWRVIIYLFIVPILVYTAASLWTVNATLQKMGQ